MPVRILILILIACPLVTRGDERAREVTFNRDIRPILSDKCFPCHGPDAQTREAELRLDQRDNAIADRGGHAAIVPGDEASSELVGRILATDPDERMPPASSNKQLTPAEIDLLRRWIAQGAVYQQHWAFEPLMTATPPEVESEARSLNPIDAFVAARLRERGWQLAPEAEPETLLRRVTLDLTGLPPTLDELKSYRAALRQAGADSRVCYEQVVDRLLQSPHFGEHLAVGWLDAARYADTNGYFGDKPRQMWLWRDWVIEAFNANMPFDQFTIEQLAGDLLPQATIRQRIATGFNRNHMANNESGSIDEEFRTEYVADRVHTTMTVWLGLSAGCAQCHDHKFDPISQREFYELFALFNNVPETGLIHADNPPPLIEVPSEEQTARLAELSAASAAAAEAFKPWNEKLAAAIADWQQNATSTLPNPPSESLVFDESLDGEFHPSAKPQGTTVAFEPGLRGQAAKFDATQHVEATLADFDADKAWTIGLWMKPDGSLSCPLSLIEPTGNRRGLEILWGKGLVTVNLVNQWGVSLIEVTTRQAMSSKSWHQVVVSYDGSRRAAGLRVFVDGEPATVDVQRDTLQGTIANSEPLRIGRRDSGLGFYGSLDEVRVIQQSLDEATINGWYWGERIRGILAVEAGQRTARDTDTLLDYYLERFAEPSALEARQRLKQAKQAEQDLRAAIPTVLVMQEMEKPRVTHRLDRGQYDQPREVVQPGVPTSIAPWLESEPRNRLGFARWVVSRENPLAARVAVNRLWHHCFGEGLVRTVDDFGSQGELPTHPELLDWLAASFRDGGWNVKALVRLIVTSQTYKQNSQFAVADAQVVDPENRWLSRGPSSRLSAEMLRDQALVASGLLVPKLGGPSVKPYQPPGLWEAVSYNGEDSYLPDTGAGLWRRSLYTYIKRQAPPPVLLTFDGPTREKCTLRRPRTNTPLQALVLLNDDTFVEAARVLACRAIKSAPTDESRIQYLCNAVLTRDAAPREIDLLSGLVQRQRHRFSQGDAEATKLVTVGSAPLDATLDVIDVAAWTVVAQAILNLDEAITKR